MRAVRVACFEPIACVMWCVDLVSQHVAGNILPYCWHHCRAIENWWYVLGSLQSSNMTRFEVVVEQGGRSTAECCRYTYPPLIGQSSGGWSPIHFQQGLKHRPRLAVFLGPQWWSPGMPWGPVESHHMIRWSWLLLTWLGSLLPCSHSQSHSPIYTMVCPLGSSCVPVVRSCSRTQSKSLPILPSAVGALLTIGSTKGSHGYIVWGPDDLLLWGSDAITL